jgi:membrane-bound lytic murein transglycosylase D
LTLLRSPPTIAAASRLNDPIELRPRLHSFLPFALAALVAGCATTPPPAEPPPKPAAPAPPPEPPAPVVAPAPPEPVVALPPATVAELEPLPPPSDDLWDRIRKGFAMPDIDDPLVAKWEQWYRERPDYVARMIDRSRRYLYYVVVEVEKRNMPLEIALLPMVESAFNPQAVSVARAAGMWQFMPSTGTHYGLQQNFWFDSRRDVLAATDGALSYLQKLYGDFNDWQLALASYNWGEGNVSRAVAKNQKPACLRIMRISRCRTRLATICPSCRR